MSQEVRGALPEDITIRTAQELRAQCINDIADTLQTIATALDAEEAIPYPIPSITATTLIMLSEIKNYGEPEETAPYLDLLRRVNAPPAVLAKGLTLAAMAGSDQASDELHTLLKREKQLNTAGQHIHNEPDVEHSILLNATVTTCRQQGVVAESWIRQYAPSPKVRWRMTAKHYTELLSQPNPYTAYSRRRLNELYTELLDEEGDTYDMSFVRQQLPDALQRADDYMLRRRLLDRYIELLPEGGPHLKELRRIINAGVYITSDYDLAASDAPSSLQTEIVLRADRLRADGVDSMALAQALTPWHITYERYEGYAPQQLITSLDAFLGRALSEGEHTTPAAQQFTLKGLALMQERDAALAYHARISSRQGDFAAAHDFIAAMNSATKRIGALSTCLEDAYTTKDAEALQLDGLHYEVQPELQFLVRDRLAMLHWDAARVGALALDVVASFSDWRADPRNQTVRFAKFTELKKLHGSAMAMGDEVGLPLARQVLAGLRKVTNVYEQLDPLSNALIQAGDSDEIAYIYETMIQGASSPVQRLQRLYALARRLPYLG